MDKAALDIVNRGSDVPNEAAVTDAVARGRAANVARGRAANVVTPVVPVVPVDGGAGTELELRVNVNPGQGAAEEGGETPEEGATPVETPHEGGGAANAPVRVTKSTDGQWERIVRGAETWYQRDGGKPQWDAPNGVEFPNPGAEGGRRRRQSTRRKGRKSTRRHRKQSRKHHRYTSRH